jgi:hypothetical protein
MTLVDWLVLALCEAPVMFALYKLLRAAGDDHA